MSKAYQPLHHKYRPQSFSDLVGQEAISATLKQALLTNRIAPAYLFSGPRGTGKTSSARILARSLNCLATEQPTTKPCGTCDLCESIANSNALDVIEIDAASNTGVDNIRELIERSRFAPVKARWKVYVIDECHMLSTAAFNALLKTLEEPPPRIVFILATTDPQRVLQTILSRCQRFDFRRISLKSITTHLTMIAEKENIDIEPAAISLIAQRSQGGLRDAESLLDQLSLLPQPIKNESVWNLLGVVSESKTIQLAKYLVEEKPTKLLEVSREIINSGKEPIAILQGLASVLRDLVVMHAAPEKPELTMISIDLKKDLLDLSNQISLENLLRLQSQLKGTENQLRQSLQPNLWLEVILLSLLHKSKISQNNSYESTRAIHHPLHTSKVKETGEQKEQKPKEIEKSENSLDSQSKLSEIESTETNQDEINLSDLWQQILGKLKLPSTKMLLSQQARLTRISSEKIFIEVASNWMSMVQSRSNLLEDAINETFNSPRQLIIESQIETFSNDETTSFAKEQINSNQDETNEITNKHSLNGPDIKQDGNHSNHLSDQNKPSLSQDLPKGIDNEAKNLADFFNGKILD